MRASVLFLQHAAKAPTIEYMMFCDSETCMCDTPHDMYVSGDWEIYTCRHCRQQTSYRVR